MPIDDNDIFDLYREKASSILRDRNTFLSIYLSGIVAVLFPLAYNGNLEVYFQQKLSVSFYILLFLAATPLTVYMYCENKYREYRWGYMKIAVRNICESEILIHNPHPETYEELCKLISEKTLFADRHIMPILRELFPPKTPLPN